MVRTGELENDDGERDRRASHACESCRGADHRPLQSIFHEHLSERDFAEELTTPGKTQACPNGNGPLSPSILHASKTKLRGYLACRTSTASPAMRPARAPTARVGMKMPAGSLRLYETTSQLLVVQIGGEGSHPKVMVVNAALRNSAAPSERTSGPTCEGEVTQRPERRSDL